MNKEEKNWSEISEEITEVKKKIKSKIKDEDLVQDLKDSLNTNIKSTAEIFKNLILTIESNVKDDEIKKETSDLIKKINAELIEFLSDTGNKINYLFDHETNDHEEE